MTQIPKHRDPRRCSHRNCYGLPEAHGRVLLQRTSWKLGRGERRLQVKVNRAITLRISQAGKAGSYILRTNGGLVPITSWSCRRSLTELAHNVNVSSQDHLFFIRKIAYPTLLQSKSEAKEWEVSYAPGVQWQTPPLNSKRPDEGTYLERYAAYGVPYPRYGEEDAMTPDYDVHSVLGLRSLISSQWRLRLNSWFPQQGRSSLSSSKVVRILLAASLKDYCGPLSSRGGSRKRRPSTSQDDQKEDLMDECTAALVLMHLSCSPHSPPGWMEPLSPAPSDACSWRSGTPSPPLSESAPSAWLSASDEGIELDDDFDEFPKKKKVKTSRHWNQLSDNRECIDITAFRDVNGEATRTVYQCTWPGCHVRTTTCNSIEAHVRNTHLGRNEGEDEGMAGDDHEEEFYYTELEVGLASPLPTLSHRDMARPAHEDPEYQKGCAMPIPSNSWPAAISPSCSQKQIKLSVSAPSSARVPSSPSRRLRGDTKKCRKVYGMEHRDLWCTQCKWKKACTRFGD
nr:uncharacterized protein LOC106678277 [Halyomorpha halys]